MQSEHQYITLRHEEDKLIAFERGDLVFVFNFHTTNSYTDYRVGVLWPGKYKAVLDTDWDEFGGHSRNDRNAEYFSKPEPWQERPNFIQLYIPARTAMVFTVVD